MMHRGCCRLSLIALGYVLWCGWVLVPTVARANDDSAVDLIVRFKPSPDRVGERRFMQHGAIHKRSLALVGAEVYRVKNEDLTVLAGDPEIEYIGADHALHATATLPSTPDYGWMTALGVGSITATTPYDGTGVAVAVIDSGLDTSADLNDSQGHSRIVYRQSFVPNDTSTSDKYGHGEMVAGLVGGNGKQSTTNTSTYLIRGIAPNVNIVNLRVLDSNGSSTDSVVIAAIEEAISLKAKYNIRVINLSLGRPVSVGYTQDPLCQAVQQAWNAGIVVVIAAGNDGRNNTYGTEGYATINAPGNTPAAITVGAMNTMGTLTQSDDKMTSYSSKGPTLLDHIVKPDLVAPGNRIFSLEATKSSLVNTYSNNRVAWSSYDPSKKSSPSPDYFELSGTSLAAPMVSGAAALLIQQNPNITPDQVKARLMKTATKLLQITTYATDPITGVTYATENDAFTVGAGYLNIPSALNSTDLATGSAASPVAVRDSNTGAVTMVTSTGAIWGSVAVWGTAAVWGTGSVTATGVIWGNGPVWGKNVAWGSSVAWGTTVAWGSAAVWGTGGTIEGDALTVAISGEN